MRDWQDFVQQLSSCGSFTEIAQLLSLHPIMQGSFSGALIALIDNDARMREAGRYGFVGDEALKEAVPIAEKSELGRAVVLKRPVLLQDLTSKAKNMQLSHDKSVEELVIQNELQSAFVIPLVERQYLFGVLALVSTGNIHESPKLDLEDSTFQALLSMAVRAVSHGSAPEKNTQAVIPPELGQRDQFILSLLGQDKTNKEIAAELNISVSSVKTSVSHIMEVLQVSSRKEAGVKARYSQLQ